MGSVRKRCLKVLLPQGYLRYINDDGLVQPKNFDEAYDILPLLDLVVLSDEDHPQANAQAHAWKRASPHTEIILTQNARGASIIHEDKLIHIPTTPIPDKQIIDSVGCGDVFSAATAYYLFATNDIELAIRSGHEAARNKLLAPEVSQTSPRATADKT
jgi:sugar/nucleoside kinase (ribokinase family)